MSDFLPHHNWWDSSVLASSTIQFGVAAAQDSYASDSIWEDLDGNFKLFEAIEELLTGEQISFWPHIGFDWGQHVILVNNIVDLMPNQVIDAHQCSPRRDSYDASAATAPAGAATLQQQKIAGKDRQHQLRYDVEFHVPPS
jgi:hypothetical protein